MDALTVTAADFANLSLIESPRLRRRLAGATRVPSRAIPADVVTMNSMVSYRDLASGERGTVQLVYPQDARSKRRDRASIVSVLGLALLGASRGEVVEYGSGAGQRRIYLEKVLHQPEHSMETHAFLRQRQA